MIVADAVAEPVGERPGLVLAGDDLLVGSDQRLGRDTELLGGPGGDWGAAEVMNVLDEAWADFDGPCDMLAAL